MTADSDDLSSTRHATRRNLRALRRALTSDQQAAAAGRVGRILGEAGLLRPGTSVAGYLATDGELSITEVLRRVRATGGQAVLPTVDGAGMTFRRWASDGDLVDGPVGLTQPPASAAEVPIEALDVILLPAVAVDRAGTRLGRGAGYYDRALAGREHAGHPLLVAVVHEVQVVDHLERAPWDVPVDAVVTDRGWWWVGGTDPRVSS